jgi:hypothetical protein
VPRGEMVALLPQVLPRGVRSYPPPRAPRGDGRTECAQREAGSCPAPGQTERRVCPLRIECGRLARARVMLDDDFPHRLPHRVVWHQTSPCTLPARRRGGADTKINRQSGVIRTLH